MTEECGILNIATCLPQALYDFLIKIINSPIQPLLDVIKFFLTEPVNLSIFNSLWAIMIYVISLFYGILLLYSGFNFIISGYDAGKRNKAKEWLRNIVIMIVVVQASYFLYSLVLDIGSLLTAGIINLVGDEFFLLSMDNIVNIGLQFVFVFLYLLSVLITALLLTIRYIIVCVGVVFIPLGVFFYFIPMLNNYGKLILNFLGICIFITFFDALIFLVCAKIVEIGFFENFKILVMISAFSLANLLMLYLIFFSAIKSAFSTVDSVATSSAVKYLK